MLKVSLLGELAVHADGTPLPLPAHPQGPALLGWLALHPGEHPRGPLAALLWPGVPESAARASLRSAVWALRRALGAYEGEVLDGRRTIGLRCTTDLQQLDSAPAGGVLLAGLEEHAWVLAARAELHR